MEKRKSLKKRSRKVMRKLFNYYLHSFSSKM